MLRVLGPVEVVGPDGVVPLGGAKERCLLAVLAVNVAEPESRVRGYLNQVRLAFPVLLDHDRTASRAWKARVLPATFIVGPDGRVRYSYFGELDWSRDSVRNAIAALLPR